jgi:transposase
MTKKYNFSNEQVAEIMKIQKENKNKNVDRRLRVLLLYSEGEKCVDIAEKTGYSVTYVSEIVRKFRNNGFVALTENHYRGNRRNMSIEEEKQFLESFKNEAEKGNVVVTNIIKRAYVDKVGHSICASQNIAY